jgi:hypothetical protein
LRGYLEAHPEAVERVEAVLADLEAYGRVLGKAKEAGARWHLAVDY